MPLAVTVSLIGAGSAAFGALLAFLARWLIDRPATRQQAQAQSGTFLLGEANYLQDALERLRRDFEESERKRFASEADCTARITAIESTKNKEIEALQIQTAKLLIRLGELESGKGGALHA